MPWNTYCSRKAALSQKQSIISVMMFVMPVSYIARRRMLYANFLMSDRLVRDFLAGDRSSRNVSSSTWWSRFSIDQCILFMVPSSSAVRIRSEISAVHWISFPIPSSAEGAGTLLEPFSKNSSFVGVTSFPWLSFSMGILICLIRPMLWTCLHSFCVFVKFDVSLHIWQTLYSFLSRFFSIRLVSSYFSRYLTHYVSKTSYIK